MWRLRLLTCGASVLVGSFFLVVGLCEHVSMGCSRKGVPSVHETPPGLASRASNMCSYSPPPLRPRILVIGLIGKAVLGWSGTR